MSPLPTGTEVLGAIPYDGQFFDKGGAVYNVMHPDFGAKGDGSTDDTTAIQAAIDELKHSGGTAGAGKLGVGGIIYFPPGIYKITKPLLVTAASNHQNISFIGAGPLTSIIRNDATDSGDAFTITGVSGNTVHGLKFEDIGVHGNSSSGRGIYCNNRTARQVEFNRLDLFDHGSHGIEFITTCNMIVFRSCRIRDNTGSGIKTSLNGEQIWMYGNSIRDNAVGVDIGSSTNICNIYGGDIHGNVLGVSIVGGVSLPVTSIEIRGVYFEDNKADILISNVVGSSNRSQNITIAANSFTTTTPTVSGEFCVEVNWGQYVYIYHNEFRNITDANISACIRVGPNAQDVYIGPNWFPTSTTRTNVSIDSSAVRTWGYTIPDTDKQEFRSWGAGRFIGGDIFTAAVSATQGAVVIDSASLTAGSGNYGRGITFTEVGAIDMRAVIVPRQLTSDADVVGLEFWVHNAIAFDAAVELFMELGTTTDTDLVRFPHVGGVAFGARLATTLITTLANDATPSVSTANLFKTGGTTTITDLDDGVVGQEIKIESAHAITITNNAAILLANSQDFVMAVGDTLILEMFTDQIWREVSRTIDLVLVQTLANDATPSVLGGSTFKTGGTTTITDFDDGVVNQELTILAEHTVTITDGSPIVLNASGDYVMTTSDTLVLRMFNDQIWHEISRSVN